MPTINELQSQMADQSPDVAVVLGSGMSDIIPRVPTQAWWDYTELPGMSATTVNGHPGRLYWGTWAGQRVLLFAGRAHYYEGQGLEAVTAPVRLAAKLGCKILILTNAAGGIRPGFRPGTLMCLFHHLKWTQPRWWARGIQKSDPIWYSYQLNDRLLETAASLGIPLEHGLYGCVTGPSYETPAEIRALRTLGVDAVGMSTALEAEAAYRLGLQTVGLSCITNLGAGLSNSPSSHAEVIEQSARSAGQVGLLLECFLERCRS